MNCSDQHLAYVCSSCGGLLSVYSQQQDVTRNGMTNSGNRNYKEKYRYSIHRLTLRLDDLQIHIISVGGVRRFRTETCRTCKSASAVKPIYLPYVYRYLVANRLTSITIEFSAYDHQAIPYRFVVTTSI